MSNKRNNKRKFDNNFSQLSKKPMASPVNCKDQDMLILQGIHGMRIISRPKIAMSPKERDKLNSLRRSCKLTSLSAELSSRDRDVEYVVKVMVHLVNTKKSNTFQTTYTRHMKLSEVQGYVTTEFKNKGLKVAQIRVDNEIVYSNK